jgi:hypothetical protein
MVSCLPSQLYLNGSKSLLKTKKSMILPSVNDRMKYYHHVIKKFPRYIIQLFAQSGRPHFVDNVSYQWVKVVFLYV